MESNWAIPVIAVLILGGLGFSQAYATSSFTELPILPGGDFSFGIGISDDGSVVVVNSNNAMGEFLGAKWTATGGLVPINDLPGGPNESFPTAVSADGSVIVGGGTTEEGQEAFMWTVTGGTVGLGAGFGSNALGVSADGSVIVGAKQVGFEAFMWTTADGIVGIGGGLEGADEFTAANDVTDDGLLIVGAGNRAYTWTEIPGAVPIDDPFFNGALAVSSDGTVIVGQGFLEATPTSGPTIVAAKWTEVEGGVSLGFLPGDSFSLANAVSPDGSIIVGSSSGASVNNAAFIWDETNGMRNLQQVLENDFGLDLNDLDLTAAWGVTSNGFITVTGEAINPSGDIRGWVAVMELPIIDADADEDGFDETVDCDDFDNTVFPGAAEIGGDGIDQDCDGFTDEGLSDELFLQIANLQSDLAAALADLAAALATIAAHVATIADQAATILGLEADLDTTQDDLDVANQEIAELDSIILSNEITICHNGAETKTIAVGALGQHLGHGDTRGPLLVTQEIYFFFFYN